MEHTHTHTHTHTHSKCGKYACDIHLGNVAEIFTYRNH